MGEVDNTQWCLSTEQLLPISSHQLQQLQVTLQTDKTLASKLALQCSYICSSRAGSTYRRGWLALYQ